MILLRRISRGVQLPDMRQQFEARTMIQDAVMRNLKIMGEAAKQIGDQKCGKLCGDSILA